MKNVPQFPAAEAKARFGPGPWQEEPDRAEFEAYGLPCLIQRGPMGALCGYVAVPPGHRLHGESHAIWEGEAPATELEVHGGLTYSAACEGLICHVPREGEPDNVWWLGFDCAHAGDVVPGLDYRLPHQLRRRGDVYRTIDYVRAQCEALAKQLIEVDGG